MSIDWFTFTAQIINFLILIWLLKRFLYGPIIRAMAEREEQIAKRFSDADKAQSRAEACERDYQLKIRELDQTRETLIAKAGQDVETWRNEHIPRAKADVGHDRQQWQEELIREKDTLLRELQWDMAGHAVELGRHVLSELADQPLESRLVDRFIEQLARFDRESQSTTNPLSSTDAVIVETAHELTVSDRKRIVVALDRADSDVTFRLNPQLICGIELQTPVCKIAWNIRESLAEVESDLIDAVEETLHGVTSDVSGQTTDPSSGAAAT